MKKYIISVLILLVVIFSFLKINDQKNDKRRLDSLKFSNTMQWEPELLGLAHKDTMYISNWKDTIVLTPPPENSSAETKKEIEGMLTDKTLRSKDKITEIMEQADSNTMSLGGRPVLDYFDAHKYPHTSQLLERTMHDLNITIMYEKEYFDRVRPHILELNIEPVLEVPKHPAYPSGHSTQAHFLGYMLGELIPDKKQSLIDEADRIARNREIAGLHYPSDSAAGVSLARQFADLVLRDQALQTLLEQAKGEWR